MIDATTEDPIAFLCSEKGGAWTLPKLAVEWDLATTATIDKWRAGSNLPTYKNAVKMSDLFGWEPGQILDHFASRLKSNSSKRKAKKR